MAQQKGSKYVDMPGLAEIFADDCISVMGSSAGVYIVLGTMRLDPTNIKSGNPKMNHVVSCRLVLTVKAMVDLYRQLDGLIGKLEQDGVVTRGSGGPSTTH